MTPSTLAPPSSPPRAALFGKLPCALDFVRENHDREESIALDTWLQASLSRLAARQRQWPAGQLAFCFGLDSARSLVGVVSDSRDRAGRRFPAAVYVPVPRPEVACGIAALVLASEPFIDGARALLARADELSLPELGPRLRRLRAPGARDVAARADALRGELARGTLGAFAAPLFPGAAAPDRCALAALERMGRPRSGDGATECFECPVLGARDLAIWASWLELAHGRPCAALWDLSRRDRALLAPGPLPERAPLFWALQATGHPRLCRVGQDPTPARGGSAEETLASVFGQLGRAPALAR